MNRFEIRDILNAHKEHFRVLPTGAMLAVQGIIDAVDEDEIAARELEAAEKAKPKKKPVKKKTPAAEFTTGKKKKGE